MEPIAQQEAQSENTADASDKSKHNDGDARSLTKMEALAIDAEMKWAIYNKALEYYKCKLQRLKGEPNNEENKKEIKTTQAAIKRCQKGAPRVGFMSMLFDKRGMVNTEGRTKETKSEEQLRQEFDSLIVAYNTFKLERCMANDFPQNVGVGKHGKLSEECEKNVNKATEMRKKLQEEQGNQSDERLTKLDTQIVKLQAIREQLNEYKTDYIDGTRRAKLLEKVDEERALDGIYLTKDYLSDDLKEQVLKEYNAGKEEYEKRAQTIDKLQRKEPKSQDDIAKLQTETKRNERLGEDIKALEACLTNETLTNVLRSRYANDVRDIVNDFQKDPKTFPDVIKRLENLCDTKCANDEIEKKNLRGYIDSLKTNPKACEMERQTQKAEIFAGIQTGVLVANTVRAAMNPADTKALSSFLQSCANALECEQKRREVKAGETKEVSEWAINELERCASALESLSDFMEDAIVEGALKQFFNKKLEADGITDEKIKDAVNDVAESLVSIFKGLKLDSWESVEELGSAVTEFLDNFSALAEEIQKTSEKSELTFSDNPLVGDENWVVALHDELVGISDIQDVYEYAQKNGLPCEKPQADLVINCFKDLLQNRNVAETGNSIASALGEVGGVLKSFFTK